MTETVKPDPVRQMLMHFGGNVTVVMAQKGFTPEQVAAASNGVLTDDEILKIMTGSNMDVPVSKLAYLAGQLDIPFGVGLSSMGLTTKPAAA